MKNNKKLIISISIIIFLILIGVLIGIFINNNLSLENSNTEDEKINEESNTNLSNGELAYSTNRDDYTSDEQFSNFRLLKGGKLKPIIYRGASPIDKTYNRNIVTDSLLKKNNINYVINLTNTEEKFKEMLKSNNYSSEYIYSLYKNNKIYFGNLSIKYDTKEYAQDMAKALIQIAKNDGPFYIHCSHGRDRTGMACIILEGLAGASYQEILDDYMKTYDNYNSINFQNNPDKYNLVLKTRFKNAITYITGEYNMKNYSSLNYEKKAEEYLKFGGLTDEEINKLKESITE